MSLSDVKFAGSGAWGSGLGRPLTRAEGDGSLYALREAVQDLIDNPVEGIGIANFGISGRQLTIYMTDSSTFGPFVLPMATPRFRGTWAGSISYGAFDIVRVGGFGTYMVMQDHTSASTFDPYVGNSDGNYYIQIGPDPFYTAQVLDVPATTLTLALSHQNKYIRSTHASGLAVTLNAGIFPPNAEIHFRQSNAGAITITEGSGVNISAMPGYDLATEIEGAVITLKHVGADQWDIFGRLAETSA